MDLLKIEPNIVRKGVQGKHFLLYGDPSTRKTTVACQFPDALLLATEIGYSLIPGVHAVNIESWGMFREVVRELKRKEVRSRYKTIIIDTVGLLTDMCSKFICDTNGVKELGDLGWGKGWKQFKTEFRTQINTLAQLGYGVVFIAHNDKKLDDNGRITTGLPQMDNKPRESVIALVDFILFLQKEPKDEKPEDITVYAYSRLPVGIETKTRARHLSPRFEFNFQNLEAEITRAVEMFEPDFVTDDEHNYYETNREPIEDLIKEVMEIAMPLVESTNMDIAQRSTAAISAIMKNTRVSQATEEDYDRLIALREALLEIRT